jgi:hypothetical protein
VGTARTKQRALEVALPLAGRRRLHAFSSGTLRFSLRKAFHAAARERACARSPATTLDIFLTENRRVPFPGSASHLAPATSGASPCEEPPFTATESTSPPRTREAGSSSSNARSDAECIKRSRRDQVLFDARAKKICTSIDSFGWSDPLSSRHFNDRFCARRTHAREHHRFTGATRRRSSKKLKIITVRID